MTYDLPYVAKVSQCCALSPKSSKGFTLIELIIVIIILGILSVTVAPKFLTSNGFSEYAYRTDIIAKLRLIQTRAMQQVLEPCHQVKLTNNKLGKADCGTPVKFIDKVATMVTIDSKDGVTLTPDDLIFTFDNMGRPIDCNSPCEIIVKGVQELRVIIEPEGYIHAE
tara:strand:+ start:1752 stop:2252 length:501 start_codon:yes stop_codon:yes gene_type:complete